jgi:YHS domain-containing protein
MAKDPVCGIDVNEAICKYTAQHDGQTNYFCAPGCKKAFEAEPEKYLDPSYQAHM